ncbi:beta-ketoacyl synthase [Methylocaldum marinum]|uniref:Beta-ketoacyl synthase n=1 Tax=Methylocaldum marinum TaxID=1432792 RepID=A0A250KTD3_9GAMM|nr:type I polyketide synthase [Methylocaldum marinum]BBA34915.1 beta-ketoacyl synthase [Methylocaldum marinum]
MSKPLIELFSGRPADKAALIQPRPAPGTLCPEENLGHLLLRAADGERGIVFVRDERQETRFSYRTIAEQALTRLGTLRALGLRRGDPVILMFRESHDFIVTFWAAVLGGMVPAPLAYPPALAGDNAVLIKLKAVWEQLDRPRVLSDAFLAEQQSALQQALAEPRIRILAVTEAPESAAPADPDLAAPDELAFIQYSSGSTGTPKGVMVTHASLITNLEGIIFGADLSTRDAYLCWMPYHHDMGLIGFHFVPLALGIEQVNMTPFTFVRKPTLWMEKIHLHRSTVTGSPNFGYRHLLSKLKPEHLKRWDLSCLRIIFNGAEPIAATVMEEFLSTLGRCGLKPEAMYPVYGMAEATLAVSFPPPGTLPRVHWLDRGELALGRAAAAEPHGETAVAVVDEGYPVPGCGLRIVDGDGRVLPEGRVGRIQIGGRNVTRGYYNNPSANAATFHDGWLDTGDLGFMMDGRLCVSGRAKDIIFVNGQNFYAHDVEAQAETVAGVDPGKTIACGWHDPGSGEEQTAIFLAIRDPESPEGRSIMAAVWQRVNQVLGIALDYVVPVRAIPKTTSGKLQRYKLLEEFQQGDYDAVIHRGIDLVSGAPESDTAAGEDLSDLVREAWADVLGLPPARIKPDQSFRSLGGTSIKAVQILGRLEDRLNRPLNHELLLRCQTVRQMAEWLGGHSDRTSAAGAADTVRAPDDAIAIIGTACRFPGSDSPEEYWELLSQGREAIGPVPADRFALPEGGRDDGWRGGFVRDVYAFDAEFFGISPEEATDMDPQQRLFLEVAAETLERAGYSRPALDGAEVGLFIGASHNNHMEFLVNALCGDALESFASLRRLPPGERDELLKEWQSRFGRLSLHVNTAVDNLLNMIAARVSHTFNWKGPSFTIDSACSSSLVAVHLACQSLRQGECSMAVAGGVSLTLSHLPFLLFQRAGALSASGRCRVFDASADGFVLGEGAGAVLLKPLSRALADGDPVLSVIRGSAVNNDGQSLGVMAPNPDGQRQVIDAVYRQFKLDPASIQFVEAHGTGTPLGDPSEIRALTQAFGNLDRQSCAVGSVKANIGHLLSAAGIAGLIKVVLALHHKQMPGNINLTEPSRQIDFARTPFYPLTATRAWTVPEGLPRRAAINSFGFGGTNCHLVVEEGVAREQPRGVWPYHLLLLSARNRPALNRSAGRLAAYLERAPAPDPADLCATLNSRRNHSACRYALVAESLGELAAGLKGLEKRQPAETGSPPSLALMFTGQGAQYPGMAAQLYELWPRFRLAMDEAAAAFDPWLDVPVLSSIYHHEANPEQLARTEITQPAMFVTDYALGRALLELGVRPAALIGHSVGEYAAACLAGAVDLADAAKVVAARGRLMSELPGQGGMLAVFARADELSAYLEDYRGRLWFAANNGSHQVVAGYRDAVAELARTLESLGRRVKPLRVSHAFHTPLLQPMLEPFAKVLAEVEWRAPRLPIISNITGDWLAADGFDAYYWSRHVLEAVRFEQGIRTAHAGGIRTFVECGPDSVLTHLAATVLAGERVTLAAMIDRRRENARTLPETLGILYTAGVDLDWRALGEDFPGRRIPLPASPFERKIYRLPPLPPAKTQGQALLHRWEWPQTPRGDAIALPPGALLVFAGEGQSAWLEALRIRLGPERPVLAVRPGAAFSATDGTFTVNLSDAGDYRRLWQAVLADYGAPAAVVHAWNADSASAQRNDDEALYSGIFSLTFLAQAMREPAPAEPCRILWLTRRAHVLDSLEPPPDPYQLLGVTFALGLGEENDHLVLQAADLDPAPAAPDEDVETVLAELGTAEFGGEMLAIRRSRRFRRRFGAVYNETGVSEPLLEDGDTCLITGGIAGIGAETAIALARSARINLVLTGRRPLPDRQTWNELPDGHPDAARVALVRRLESLGATVDYHAADVADAEAMTEAVKRARERFGRLDGVIHSAGVVDRKVLRATDKNVESIRAVLAPKVEGSLLLHRLTADQPLKFFILYSSIAATCPVWAASLTDYAAANAFLDGFAEWRNRSGAKGRALALNWSLWDETGMGRDTGLMALVRSKGLRALVPETACAALARALAIPGAAVVHVIDFEAETETPAPAATAPSPEPAPVEREPLAAHPPVHAADWLDLVRQLTGAYLNAPAEGIDPGRRFQELGVDSRGAVEMAEKLAALLGCHITPTLLFEFQSPLDLARHLESRHGSEFFSRPPDAPAPARPISVAAGVASRSERAADDRIAVVGMSLRVPGCASTDQYWRMLAEGRCEIREVPRERWSPDDYFDAANRHSHASYSKWGGFLDRVHEFDPQFFGISPREAKAMDPQQRIFMEVAYEALQQSGYAGEGQARRLGVFVGCEQNYYAEHFINQQRYCRLRDRIRNADWYRRLPMSARADWDEALRDVLRPAELQSDAIAGNGLNEIACRLSHWLNVRGPSLIVNTACSAALVATHLACQSLRSGESRIAVAGGAYLNMGSTPFVFLSRVNAMSPDGRCYPFDRRANGMVLGEGVAVLVLKPLADALADGDFIHGVILGSAMNNDGHSSGLTAPNPAGQADCVARAYRESGVDPATVSYVECHGTGTSLGDPVEVEGMTQAFRRFTDRRGFCGIGSVKSSIGHMLSAAGIPSAIKVLLAMRHGYLPPTVNYAEPNPYIDFDASPFFVVDGQGRPWTGNGQPRRAGVNAFGFGGTNCHLILEEPPRAVDQPTGMDRLPLSDPQLLCLTARTQSAVCAYAEALHAHLRENPSISAEQVVYSLNGAQREMNFRAAAVVRGRDELLAVLAAVAGSGKHDRLLQGRANPKQPPAMAWMFDDGPWPEGTADTLARRCSVFADAWTAFRKALPPGHEAEPHLRAAAEQYSLGRLLRELDLVPSGLWAEGASSPVAAAVAGWLSPAAAASVLIGGDAVPEHAAGDRIWRIPIHTSAGKISVDSPDWPIRLRSAASSRSDGLAPPTDARFRTLLLGGKAGEASGPLPMIGAEPDGGSLLTALARLYIDGLKLDTRALCPSGLTRVLLPAYPFERKAYLYDPPPAEIDESADIPSPSAEPNPPEPAHPGPATASKEPQQDIATALLDELNRIILPRQAMNEHS